MIDLVGRDFPEWQPNLFFNSQFVFFLFQSFYAEEITCL